jgi:hypothetical protein
MIPNYQTPDSASGDPQAQFGMVLHTVVGQAFEAAGFRLADSPTQQAAGLFRYVAQAEAGAYAGLYLLIEFQMLYYTEGRPARFHVVLARAAQPDGRMRGAVGEVRRDLAALVVEDFGVAVLPSASHWWSYAHMDALGRALAEAGHLVVGFGIPWLRGAIEPPASSRA